MINTTRSVLRYPGGKARFAPLLAQAMDMNGMNDRVLIEAFCGGSAVSIAFLLDGIVESAIINDADPLVSAFWSCVFNEKDAAWLAKRALTIELSINEWKRQKALTPANKRDAALKCLYLNRTSFNGILHQAGPIGGWGQEKRTLGARFNQEKIYQKILDLSKLTGRVQVFNEDWKSFCDKHRGNEKAFFYLDPPYYYKANQLYGYIFDEAGHVELRDYLIDLESPWILSYDDSRDVRNLYKGCGFEARVIDQTYSAHPLGGSSFIGRELLYTNMQKLPPPGKEKSSHTGISIRGSVSAWSAKREPARFPVNTYA
jgi:DNA adenine methylase